MCGICGVVQFGAPADTATVQAMTNALAHRGPDGCLDGVPARRGLVRRRVSEADRRFALVSLTEDGHAFIEAVGAHSESIYRDLTARVGEARLAELMSLLREVEAIAGEGAPIESTAEGDAPPAGASPARRRGRPRKEG